MASITPFQYQGATIVAVEKEFPHVDGYQLCSKEGGWTDGCYSRDYLVSIGAAAAEIDAIRHPREAA